MNYDGFIEMLSINSTSSSERELALHLASTLPTAHCSVETMEVGDGTLNVMLSWGNPRIVFCSHLDTVPPYIAPTVEGDVFFGRGTCDAKGQIWSLYQACLQLEAEGCTDFGLLLLAGEETGSWGAKHFAKNHCGAEYLVVGEPTDNKMVSAAKGTKAFQVEVSGVSCHSGYPERGVSAVENFVAMMNYLKAHQFATDPLLGATTWNVGRLTSDNPQNILSNSLSCRVYFRTTFASDADVVEVMKLINDMTEDWGKYVSVEALGGDTPTRFFTVDGIDTTTVAFGSDAPHLNNFAHKMLCGPGSITVAHTPDEFVTKHDLELATRHYVAIYHSIFNN